jgi:hypothetical protein
MQLAHAGNNQRGHQRAKETPGPCDPAIIPWSVETVSISRQTEPAVRNQSRERDDLFFAAGVMLGVSLRGFLGVMRGMRGMAMRHHRVMGSLFNRSRLVVLGGFAMVLCGRFMMLGSADMMFCNFGCSHCSFPSHSVQFEVAPLPSNMTVS